jgi:SNF2 family DNA or RNA helicase
MMYNAAALLNPRGFQKTQRVKTDNSPSPVPQRKPATNITFQFDSPSDSPSPMHSNGASMKNEHEQYGTNGSMGNPISIGGFVERMHNVSEREFHPQKRRKIEQDDVEVNEHKSSFNGGGKSGVLGEYMKQKREEGRQEAKARGTSRAVDLTEDDEVIEVIELPSDADKEVCYGRLEGTNINAHIVPSPKPGTRALTEGYWPQVKVILARKSGERTSVVQVYDATRKHFGCLDVNTAIGLVPLLDSSIAIRTAARILARPKKEDDLPEGSLTSCRYNLDLNIYGPKKYASVVGRHFSQKQLWLRTPLFVEAGIELVNPHALQKAATPSRLGLIGNGYATTSGFQMRTVEEVRSDVISMFDSLEKSENLPEMDADPRITTALLPHQKQGLYFLTNKEKERVFGENEADNSSLWRLKFSNNGAKSYYNVITGQEERHNPPQVLGGILADMMGLGKTLSILSLVIATLEESKEWAKRSPPPPDDQDVQVKQTCKATLLVSPLSTISNWEEQIGQHIQPGTLKYHIYHGSHRLKDVEKLADFDLVITTYGSLASECNNRMKGKPGKYPLEELSWFRVVLDEAHMIREQTTLQSKAICRLQAQRRWAVTGTPVQNRLDDLGALLKFLRVKPFDTKQGFSQHILGPCKQADPEILPKLRLLVDSITLRRLKDRIDLPKRSDHIVRLKFNAEEQQLYDIFAKNAQDRVKVLTNQRGEKILGGKSYVHILQSILRLRLICAHGKELLSEEDLKIMAGLSKSSAIDLDSDEDEDDKPALSSKQAYDMYNLMRETNSDACAICTGRIGPDDVEDSDSEKKDEVIGHMTPCFHLLCNRCIKDYKHLLEQKSADKKRGYCPICHMEIRISFFTLRQGKVEEDDYERAEVKDHAKRVKELGEYGGPHTKTKALIEDLLESKRESEIMFSEPPIKSVVFSGWTSHLDLLEIALSNASIPFTRLDGKMSRTARSAALEAFRSDPNILVILVSITAGGLGLNLTTANKVYVMEPQYNPAAEAQAVDRVHRLGQTREVTTVRYIMEDSFEEKMLELQEKKKKLASLSMDRDADGAGPGGRRHVDRGEMAKKRLEDLRSLFK